MGSVSAGQGALLDALVIAAMQGIPQALLDHEDLQPRLLGLAESVGPLVAADVVGAWTRALAEPEFVCVEVLTPQDEPDLVIEPDPEAADALEQRVLTLIEKLRPPPPVSINA